MKSENVRTKDYLYLINYLKSILGLGEKVINI